MPDTLPLRDIWRCYSGTGATPFAPFEKFTWTGQGASTLKDFGAGSPGDYASTTTGLGVNDRYICAWGPNDPKPKMIRITIALDDPAGRLPNKDGQTFEYIFTLP